MMDVDSSACPSSCMESGGSDSTPGSPLDSDPCDDNCDAFAVEQIKPFSTEPPVADAEPDFDYLLAGLLSEDVSALSFSPSPDLRHETISALNWRFYATAARPIRGPSV